jgi:multidrug efflux pump subunit AcrB
MTRRASYLFVLLIALSVSCASSPPTLQGRQVRVVTVTATWNGRSPERVASMLAKPLEEQLREIDGIARIVTQCNADTCTMSLEHDSRTSSMDLQFKVNAAVNQLRAKLPRGTYITVRAVDPNREPDITLALVLNVQMLTNEHYTAALDYALRLMQLPGTVQFRIRGMPKQTELVQPNLSALKRYGLTVDDITKAIREHTLVIDDYRRVIIGPKHVRRGNALPHIILKQDGRQSVRLRDVAHVRSEVSPTAQFRVNGESAIIVDLFLRPDAARREVATCLERVLKQTLPPNTKRLLPLAARTRQAR